MESSKKIRIEKGSVQETLVIPLFGRRLCSERFPELYQDRYAADICSRLDYDFSELEKKQESSFWQFGALEAAVREMDMIWEIKDYLKQHPKAAVVNLGCGLNMTGRSADNGECKIYNLDFEDVITTRNQIIPPGEREQNIAVDLNDFSWMDKLDADEGAVLYAAGVFHYFKTEQIKRMVLAMTEKFPGGRLVFDTVGPFGRDVLMKKMLKKKGMTDIKGLFCVKSDEELRAWSDKIRVSRRGYMQGYYPLRDPHIKRLHKALAHIGDHWVRMSIYRLDFAE